MPTEVQYVYEDVDLPAGYDLDTIKTTVQGSAMTNKNVLWIRYDEEEEGVPSRLSLDFDANLSSGDVTILDGIVAALP